MTNSEFAKFLTLIEREGVTSLRRAELLCPPQISFRLGITGPPGAGKSTLIGGLIQEFRKRKLSVGVLAVDPSSPFSQGAILGDRIRYNQFFNDEDVFVRSIGSRGSLGGLASISYLLLRAYDVFGFDVTLVETVGVGQTELEIMNVADHVTVVLVPESGDSVQMMKAGILEIADLFVVNKFDRPGGETLAKELKNSLDLGEAKKDTKILTTVATELKGIEDLSEELLRARNHFQVEAKKMRTSKVRLQSEAKALLRLKLENQILQKSQKVKQVQDLKKILR